MSVTSGYGLSSLSGTVTLNLDKSQGRLQTDVTRLSSGLRINTAADDPSGLAIAEGLQAKVNGYDQASSNVQTATNAFTVADGALQTVTDLLQRLRVLAVQANDDLLSAGDRSNIQTESIQLQDEIDAIGQNTNFNGIALLNRQPYTAPAQPVIGSGTFATTPSVSGYTNTPSGSAWTFGTANAFGGQGVIQTSTAQAWDNIQTPSSGSAQVGVIYGNGAGFSQSVSNFQANSTYALTFNLAQGLGGRPPENINVNVDGVTIANFSPTSTDPLNPDWHTVTTPAFAVSAGTHVIELRSYVINGRNLYMDNLQIVRVSGPTLTPQLGASALSIHDGASEGNVTNVTLPTVFTSNLGISADTVADSTAAATYETHLDSALDAVNGARATLGAQMVRLQYQAVNDDTAAVNLTGSESNIRDLNVAQATTAYAAEQIISSIGTSILGNFKTLAASVEKLFQ